MTCATGPAPAPGPATPARAAPPARPWAATATAAVSPPMRRPQPGAGTATAARWTATARDPAACSAAAWPGATSAHARRSVHEADLPTLADADAGCGAV